MSRPSPTDFAAQRETLDDRRAAAEADIERARGGLAVAVLDGPPAAAGELQDTITAGEREIAATEIASRELDRRKQADDEAAAAARRAQLEKQLAAAVKTTQERGANLVVAVDEVATALAEADEARQKAARIAKQLGLTPGGHFAMAGLRDDLAGLLAARLGIETRRVHPNEAAGFEVLLRAPLAFKEARNV